MFSNYRDIFDERGADYHSAMARYPEARRSEFCTALELLDLKPGLTLCDIPSGGGYLGAFLPDFPVHLSCVETSLTFARAAAGNVCVCDSISELPMKSESCDRVLSLAGVHHLSSRYEFYREVVRLLKPESGLFVLADVLKGSDVDGFLNQFVDQQSSMGHKGEFLDENTIAELQDAGFSQVSASFRRYPWRFDSKRALAEYCKLLFGMDRATPDEIIDGVAHHLGIAESAERCEMNWALYFLTAKK